MTPCNICLSLSSVWHLAQWPQDLSMLSRMARFPYFLWLNIYIVEYIIHSSADGHLGCFYILKLRHWNNSPVIFLLSWTSDISSLHVSFIKCKLIWRLWPLHIVMNWCALVSYEIWQWFLVLFIVFQRYLEILLFVFLITLTWK